MGYHPISHHASANLEISDLVTDFLSPPLFFLSFFLPAIDQTRGYARLSLLCIPELTYLPLTLRQQPNLLSEGYSSRRLQSNDSSNRLLRGKRKKRKKKRFRIMYNFTAGPSWVKFRLISFGSAFGWIDLQRGACLTVVADRSHLWGSVRQATVRAHKIRP